MNAIEKPIELLTETDVKLAEHAEVIRALGKRAAHDIIEIGRRLIDAKQRCVHGRWLTWLETELQWPVKAAQRFMLVAEAAAKNANLAHLEVPMSGLYLLAAPSTPAEVIEAVAERAEAGERLSLDEVKRMIAEASELAAKGARDDAVKAADAERKKAEARVEQLTKAHDDEVAALRGAAAKAEPAMSLDEIEAMIAEAVAPLKAKIARYKERLDAKPKKTIPNPYGLTSQHVTSTLRMLVEAMAGAAPPHVIEAARLVNKLTNQPLSVALADNLKNARVAAAWLNEFISLAQEAIK